MKAMDKHHIVWSKNDFSKGWPKRLRDHWYLCVKIPRDTLHQEIHCKVSHIPVPKPSNIKIALAQLAILEKFGGICQEDDIEKRVNVLCALFDCVEPATYEALKAQLDIIHEFNKKAPI